MREKRRIMWRGSVRWTRLHAVKLEGVNAMPICETVGRVLAGEETIKPEELPEAMRSRTCRRCGQVARFLYGSEPEWE